MFGMIKFQLNSSTQILTPTQVPVIDCYIEPYEIAIFTLF